jgi:hypothetical protein
MKLNHISRNEKDPSTVVCAGRYGLVSRRRVIPINPRTQRQTEVRRHLAEQARRFGELTDAQRDAWNAAATTYRSHPRQGQSGPLTGLHLFIRVNCKLALFGLEPLNTPPPPPVFPELAPQDLVITNTAGVIAVKLVFPADPGDNTVLRASPPQSPGRGTCREFRVIGMCPAPVAAFADITALYTACFGPPPAGRRIFLRASTMLSGFESLPREFRALVPACVAEASSSPKPWPTPARRRPAP